ncbi:MAG: BatD family protein [Saccharospirillum sp.]|nr:BatD family protein [Saccharospirillum sp.]
MVIRFFSLCLLWLLALPAFAVVSASVDRTVLFDDETLTLTIRAEAPVADQALDMTAVSNQFEVVRQGQSTQSRITLGSAQRWREWQLVLRPRQTGNLTIPAFNIGGERTEPIQVEVRNASSRPDGLDEDDVVLDISLSKDNAYIGEAVTLTIELRYRIQLQGSFDRLNFGDFQSEKIDEVETLGQQDGRQYRVYRLVYRLSADEPGRYRIPDIRFNGQYQDGPFGNPRRLTRAHPGFVVNIKSIPADYPDNAYWLPAQRVALSDNLPSRLSVTANNHLDWTITTEAIGLSAADLPNPVANLNEDGFRLYVNSPEFENDGLRARRRDLNALVFLEPGEYELPAVRIPWWNLEADQLEYAEIPARMVEIRPDPNAPVGSSGPVSSFDNTPLISYRAGWWPWVSLTLGLGWMATALVWWAASRRRPYRGNPVNTPYVNTLQVPEELTRAAKAGEGAKFRAGLSRFAAQNGTTLAVLKAQLTDAERTTLSQLDALTYGGEDASAVEARQMQQLLNSIVRIISSTSARSGNKEPEETVLYP